MPGTIKHLITQNFLQSIEELKQLNIVKSLHQFTTDAGFVKSTNTRMKKEEGYVPLELIYEAVNSFNLNANHVFAKDGLKNEELLRSSINSPTIHGNNNNVVGQNGKVNINGNSGSVGDITIADKIYQHIPDKKYREEYKKQMAKFSGVIEGLKKMADGYLKQIEDKDQEIASQRKLIETQEKLISALEKEKSKKK